MSINGIVQGQRCLKCHYLNAPGYVCKLRPNGCSIKSVGNTTRGEDKKNVRLVITYGAMAALTDGGTTKLNALLEVNGFDIGDNKELYEFHHDDDKQVEFLQRQEWTDAD